MEVQFDGQEALISFPWPPPVEKDELRRLGARWDPIQKAWRSALSCLMVRWLDEYNVVLPEGVCLPQALFGRVDTLDDNVVRSQCFV